ncbi:M28 family peptidase [Subsaximicrobium wynnwilliamsii]|uniref:M28 family peptidase n=1 Tax=Subsaximicrobium wynnwilliamsii TaxID=291179 RepID=A0A5C6ZJI6_9FLAO|nr:M28 family peptidase [Subsaximicrobium wynnwilliamsii]TXD83641.1 M28 family peptidase [Subsaximicrobium wynnwilliamsii]TXD89474.1 M28 family peptidase [Subsaximicrobium wynnwilliamsii]TXE03478.1 M28 family peptidase [Subsaximicrobium wynnwilliamsii]
MKILLHLVLLLFLGSLTVSAQSIQDLIDQVNIEKLETILNEFSGEQSSSVNGNTVTILNRQQANNELAADYLVERLSAMEKLSITDQAFNTNGRNIIATQVGTVNPESVYIVCAHYDSTANYCADDNATGVAAVLEIARILSTQCLENTIVYALWDEEEIGLLGSAYYAAQAAANADAILGVLNIDMMGYDGDAVGTPGDNQFDIDYRDIAGSTAMKNDIISVLNTYTFDLKVVEVNPGTYSSDHSSFWDQGYSALLVGESWETNDQTPFYHSSADRVATLDLPYFHEMVKLVLGYMVTKAELVAFENGVTSMNGLLTATQNASNYQWINVETNTPILGETNQSFTPLANGIYAVEISLGSCTEQSEPIVVDNLGVNTLSTEDIRVYPNPVNDEIRLSYSENFESLKLKLYDVSGKLVKEETLSNSKSRLSIKSLPKGIYFLKVVASEKSGIFKIIKE